MEVDQSIVEAFLTQHAPLILQRLTSGKFDDLVRTCEEYELTLQEFIPQNPTDSVGVGTDAASTSSTAAPPQAEATVAVASIVEPERLFSPEQAAVLYTVHMFSYMLAGDLNGAHFLWKRTPTVVQQSPQAATAHDVLMALWQRQYAEFFSKINTPWDPCLQPLVGAVTAKSREDVLDKIGAAYKVISVVCIGSMLNVDTDAARAACDERKWPIGADGYVSPVPTKVDTDLLQMGDAQLKKLAEYVAYLEQPQCRM